MDDFQISASGTAVAFDDRPSAAAMAGLLIRFPPDLPSAIRAVDLPVAIAGGAIHHHHLLVKLAKLFLNSCVLWFLLYNRIKQCAIIFWKIFFVV
jgi:hypothetical protein